MEGVGNMTNKQQAQQSAASEAITPQSLLHRYKLYNEIVEKYRTKNIVDAGLDIKRANVYTPQTKLKMQERLEEFIKSTTHPKTGVWITSAHLLDQGILSEQDVEQFETPLPYARLNRLTHVKTPDGKEWLEKMFTLFCLDRSGNVVHRVFTNNDFYHMPVVQHMSVPESIDDRDGKQIHVDIVKDDIWMEPTGKKVQLLEYSEEKVHSILREIPPVGSYSDVYNGCSLVLQKVGEIHDLMCVKSLEEYFEPFETVWHRYRDPNPTGSINVKSLVEELHKQSLANQSAEVYQ
jgi:hypothetical protein